MHPAREFCSFPRPWGLGDRVMFSQVLLCSAPGVLPPPPPTAACPPSEEATPASTPLLTHQGGRLESKFADSCFSVGFKPSADSPPKVAVRHGHLRTWQAGVTGGGLPADPKPCSPPTPMGQAPISLHRLAKEQVPENDSVVSHSTKCISFHPDLLLYLRLLSFSAMITDRVPIPRSAFEVILTPLLYNAQGQSRSCFPLKYILE